MSGGSSKLKNTVCQKICFKTKKLALKRLEEINSDSKRKSKCKLKSVYLCPEHKQWHLTSMTDFQAKKIKERKTFRENLTNPDSNMILKRIEYLEQVPRIRNKFNKK